MDRYVFALSIEASGDVTPAPAAGETDIDEAEPRADDEEMTDG